MFFLQVFLSIIGLILAIFVLGAIGALVGHFLGAAVGITAVLLFLALLAAGIITYIEEGSKR